MAAVHPGGAGIPRTAGELWKDPLESHEVPGGGERGEVYFQVHSASDRTLMSRPGKDQVPVCSDDDSRCSTTV